MIFFPIIVSLLCSVSFYPTAECPSHTCIYTFFFSHYPPSCSITSDEIQFPVLYSRIELLLHSKCNSLQLLTPDSQSIPLLPPLPWQPQVCCQVHEVFGFFGCFLFVFCFCLVRATPAAYEGSQARGSIGAIAASLGHSHSNAGSEPALV